MMNGVRTFTGSAEDSDTMDITIRNVLARAKALSAIRDGNERPTRANYPKEQHFQQALREYEDTAETAFVLIYSLIEPGSQLFSAVEHLIDARRPLPLYQAIRNFFGAKTVAKAMEIVTAIARTVQASSTSPTALTMQYNRLMQQLSIICTSVPAANATPQDDVEKYALTGRVLVELLPYAMQMLNVKQAAYMAPFVQLHINTIREDLCDVSFAQLRANFNSYCISSTEYRSQQAIAASNANSKQIGEKRKHDDSDKVAFTKVKAMVTQALHTIGGRGRGRTADRGKGGRGHGGRNPSPMTLLPFADRCARCVAAYVKKNPGTPAEQARVNHKGNECRKMADEHANHTQANMAVVSTSVPEGVTAFMAGTTGLCSTYHKFYIDSGANAVIVNRYYRHLMYDVHIPTVDTSIEGIGNETNLSFELIGKIKFMEVELRCLYAPNITKSVLSVSILCSTSIFKLVFDDDYVIVINKHSKIQYKAQFSHERLYELNTTLHSLFKQTTATVAMLASVRPINQYDLWHARLGHVHEDMIRYMSSNSIYQERGLKITDTSFDSKERDLCSTCAIAKPTRSHSHATHRRHPVKGRLWYMDVSGPFVVESLVHHNRYIIIFVDSSSRMIFDYYTKEVDAESILDVMKSFNSDVLSSVTLDGDIIFIQSDNGQMKSDTVIAYIRRNNILNRFTYPYHPAMNPLAERAFRSIKEMGRCQLQHAGLPDPYWEKSCSYAVKLLNILPNRTPEGIVREAYYQWYGLTFDYSLLRTFGARSYAMNQIVANDFGPRSEEGIFVGFDKGQVSILRMVYLPSKNTFVAAGDGQMSEHVGRPQPERLLPLISESDREYTLADFAYLNGTRHRDPHEGVNYKVVKVYIHKGLIVVDRVLYDTSSPSSTKRKTYDTIHARDVATYPMLDSRGELMHIVTDNAISALIPVSSAADTYNTQADRSLDSRERNTQPSLVSSVTKSAIHTSEGVYDMISDSGALTTSHSSTTVQQIQEVGSLEPKICVEDKSCVEKNTRKRTHASSSRAAAEEDVLTKTDKMLTHDSKMLTHASKMLTHARAKCRHMTAECRQLTAAIIV
jgi:hypothetical protein